MPEPMVDIRQEARRTDPDIVVYLPGDMARATGEEQVPDDVDHYNTHFIVTTTPSGTFVATWTQTDEVHGPNQRIVVARSLDGGQTWSVPTIVDGPEPGTHHIASWPFLVVVPHTGRLYCFFHKNTGVVDYDLAMTGVLAWRVSDNDGATWGERFQTPIGRSAIDHPDPNYLSNWVPAGWQVPIVNARGQVVVPITRHASANYHDEKRPPSQQHHEAWFLRFDNIMTETDPAKIAITTWPRADHGIRIPNPADPQSSACREPAIQNLSDGRILCLLRTMTGRIHYSVSSDYGESWSEPDVLRFVPGGPEVLHPHAPCPLFRLRDGRYLLLFHNNDGTANGAKGPADSASRRPVWASVGREIDNPSGQPIVLGKPKVFYDNGGQEGRWGSSLSLYGSFTEYAGVPTWWYLDGAHFLLGRTVPSELLDDTWLGP